MVCNREYIWIRIGDDKSEEGEFPYFLLITASTPAAPNPAMMPATGAGDAGGCVGVFTGDAVGCCRVGSGVASTVGVGVGVAVSQTDEP